MMKDCLTQYHIIMIEEIISGHLNRKKEANMKKVLLGFLLVFAVLIGVESGKEKIL